MKKEKTVRTYQRRTKSGKMVTVHEHKASYDAAEEARKAAAKKAGAGSELSKKKAAVEENPLGFSADDYKEWYHWDMEDDPKNEAALRVEKTLTKKMGKKAYNKYLEDMSNSYSARGHKKAHQALLDEYTAQQKKQDVESAKTAKDIARSAKEKAAEAKASKVKTKENKSIKAPKNESLEQRDARWNRGEFTDDEKSMAIMVYDMSGPKNNLHPKLSAWAKKEIKHMDDERASKVDTKILKGLDRDVISKLATLQGKKKLSKEDEAFIDKHVAPSGLIRGTKVSAFDALAAYKKDIVRDAKDSSVDKKVQKAADAAGFKIKPKGNGKYLIQMGTGKWRTVTGEDIISQSSDEVSLHPSWKESKESKGSDKSSPTPKKKSKDSDLVEHYDQFNKKSMGKAVGDSFTFSEGRGKDKFTYDARFVTDGKGRYGYVVRDKEEGPDAKYYVGISDGYERHSQLPAGLRKAAEAQGLRFKNGEFVKKETKGDRAVARMNKLVNEALSSTTSDPKALKKQLGALIDYNGGPVNRGDKIGKRIDEIREQLGKRSSKKRVAKKSDYDYETSMKNLENYFAEERRKITSKGKNVGSKKPLTSYQKHAINSLLNQPGWSMSKAEKYVRTLSDKEVRRLAHKDM